MSSSIPRMRMFAGPNGSGKSTLKTVLPSELIGIYLNPDELGSQIQQNGFLDFGPYKIAPAIAELRDFFRASTLLQNKGLTHLAADFQIEEGRFIPKANSDLSYLVSVLSDFIRRSWLREHVSFTFETVMSARDKVELLKEAQSAGYRTYLYYICTDDPEINVSRVHARVEGGGHDVPRDKIITRYWRSLDLLFDAIGFTNRAFIFDNSGEGKDHTWIAEIEGGKTMILRSALVPAWFEHSVIDKRTAPQL